jgi:hypothetical protein
VGKAQVNKSNCELQRRQLYWEDSAQWLLDSYYSKQYSATWRTSVRQTAWNLLPCRHRNWHCLCRRYNLFVKVKLCRKRSRWHTRTSRTVRVGVIVGSISVALSDVLFSTRKMWKLARHTCNGSCSNWWQMGRSPESSNGYPSRGKMWWVDSYLWSKADLVVGPRAGYFVRLGVRIVWHSWSWKAIEIRVVAPSQSVAQPGIVSFHCLPTMKRIVCLRERSSYGEERKLSDCRRKDKSGRAKLKVTTWRCPYYK